MIAVWVIWVYAAGGWTQTDDVYVKRATCEEWARQKAEVTGAPTVCRKTKIPAPPSE